MPIKECTYFSLFGNGMDVIEATLLILEFVIVKFDITLTLLHFYTFTNYTF